MAADGQVGKYPPGSKCLKVDDKLSPKKPAYGKQRYLTLCPACGAQTTSVRAKLVCSRCHRIVETCCEGF